MTKFAVCSLFILTSLLVINVNAQNGKPSAQEKDSRELKYHLNEDGSHYVKATFLNQIWVRNTWNNPGTTVDGYLENQTFDIGLRRTRIQLFGKIADNIFFYTQFGNNNLTYLGERKQGLFFHDALGELEIIENKLSIGTGLTGWNGVSRYASPSIGSILSLDAPLYQQTTNDATDQFLRKYSLYFKGKLNRLDYRMAISKPMSVSRSTVQSELPEENALFAASPASLQWHGYYMYQFQDLESNLTPYNAGSYLGKKTVFNLGAGFLFQNDAMWFLNGPNEDLEYGNLSLFSIDVFYDQPLDRDKGTAITAYGAFQASDYGRNYVRNLGVMNPTNGTMGAGTFNGAGNNFPMMGTGNTFYGQIGYLMKRNLLGTWGTLQPFLTSQFSDFDGLDDPMLMYEYGFNWLIRGNQTKLSIHYQSRPVFMEENSGTFQTDRKGMLVMQFQIAI
ncbi:hypothetical protein [Cyclobacterium sp.]|uniref:hypothetical protein n=1 Tax=Cyclobacterium sp. TaxID=1966343 RepID=UPI0019CD293C|nr:hypothetical protein [Cyclobacterium sp.]MBD3629021.1 hypothetical protein [Cyclobacterium sp.]